MRSGYLFSGSFLLGHPSDLNFFFFKSKYSQLTIVVLVAGIEQSESNIYIYISFQNLFHYGFLQGIEYSSLSYKLVFVVYLFYIQWCVSPSVTIGLFYVCESICILKISLFISLF